MQENKAANNNRLVSQARLLRLVYHLPNDGSIRSRRSRGKCLTNSGKVLPVNAIWADIIWTYSSREVGMMGVV